MSDTHNDTLRAFAAAVAEGERLSKTLELRFGYSPKQLVGLMRVFKRNNQRGEYAASVVLASKRLKRARDSRALREAENGTNEG
jgi:hypothetical protein